MFTSASLSRTPTTSGGNSLSAYHGAHVSFTRLFTEQAIDIGIPLSLVTQRRDLCSVQVTFRHFRVLLSLHLRARLITETLLSPNASCPAPPRQPILPITDKHSLLGESLPHAAYGWFLAPIARRAAWGLLRSVYPLVCDRRWVLYAAFLWDGRDPKREGVTPQRLPC